MGKTAGLLAPLAGKIEEHVMGAVIHADDTPNPSPRFRIPASSFRRRSRLIAARASFFCSAALV